MMVLYPQHHSPEAAMLSIPQALARIKGQLSRSLPEARIRPACRDAGHAWRDRTLGPVVTTYLLLRQVLHGNPAVGCLRRLSRLDFSDSAYCQARARLPLHVLP